MTSFGWKRKLGEKISKEQVQKFCSESKDDGDDDEQVDWLNPAPPKKAFFIEDSVSKSERLKKEGIILAETERFWEAISKWNEAIQLMPGNETLMEMKAQALMSVGEVLPAVQAAQKTVELAPRWWVAHQTLGRALINIGEVKMALRSFSQAIHLNPSDHELWKEDLQWTQSILAGREAVSIKSLTNVKKSSSSKEQTISIKELKDNDSLHEDGDEKPEDTCDELVPYSYSNVVNVGLEEEELVEANLVQIPDNYVHMRDPT